MLSFRIRAVDKRPNVVRVRVNLSVESLEPHRLSMVEQDERRLIAAENFARIFKPKPILLLMAGDTYNRSSVVIIARTELASAKMLSMIADVARSFVSQSARR